MVLDKKYHTVPMILITNICLTELVCGSNTLAMSIVTLQNDLQQIQYQDSLCIFRGYLSYASCALQSYSYLLSAIYRYMIIVYPARLIWQTARMQILLIILSWIIAFGFPIPFLFTGVIIYDVDDQNMSNTLSIFILNYLCTTLCLYNSRKFSYIYLYEISWVCERNEQTLLPLRIL